MGANGNTVGPALKAKIEHYMSSITADMLHQVRSYVAICDCSPRLCSVHHTNLGTANKQSLRKLRLVCHLLCSLYDVCLQATAADSKDTLSHSVPGLHLSSNELVSHFLESKRLGARPTAVPASVQRLMTQGEPSCMCLPCLLCLLCEGLRQPTEFFGFC